MAFNKTNVKKTNNKRVSENVDVDVDVEIRSIKMEPEVCDVPSKKMKFDHDETYIHFLNASIKLEEGRLNLLKEQLDTFKNKDVDLNAISDNPIFNQRVSLINLEHLQTYDVQNRRQMFYYLAFTELKLIATQKIDNEKYIASNITFVDKSQFAVGGTNMKIKVFDFGAFKKGDEVSIVSIMNNIGKVSVMNWIPDINALASADYDGTVRIWNVVNQEQVAQTNPSFAHTKKIYSMDYADGIIATVSADGTIKLWDVDRNDNAYSVKSHKTIWINISEQKKSEKPNHPQNQIAIEKTIVDQKLQVAKQALRVADAVAQQARQVTDVVDQPTRQVRIALAQQVLQAQRNAAQAQQTAAKALMSRSQSQLQQVDTVSQVQPCSVRFNPFNPTKIIVGCSDQSLYYYDWTLGAESQFLKKLEYTCRTISYIEFIDENTIIVSTISSKLLLIDINSGKIIHEYTGHTNIKNFVGFDVYDKTLFAIGSENKTVYVYHILLQTPIASFKIDNVDGFVSSVRFHYDDNKLYLIVGTNTSNVHLFELN